MRAQLFLFVLFAASSYGMQGGGPKTFATADEARDALIQAVQEGGPAINQLFGAGADKLLRSGDEVLDKNHRERFVKVARDKAIVAIDEENPDRAVVRLGELEWPFPVPLVRKGGRWLFDLQQGKVEIRNRLIGGNELDAIEVCRGYVEAQYQYAESDRDGNGVPEYAQRIISSPGKKDGLYWPSPDSPIAEAVAKVVAQGYKDKLQPFHGYHFKVLTAQGADAYGGARDYIVQGMMLGGFALLAWPAEYGVSGIKTFIVNHEGIVYEKDLGLNTQSLAKGITRFNPDSSWQIVADEP